MNQALMRKKSIAATNLGIDLDTCQNYYFNFRIIFLICLYPRTGKIQ